VTLSALADGKFREVNEGFTTITGYLREEALGRTSEDLNLWVKPADRRQLVKSLQTVGQSHDLETVFRRKSGEDCDCQISADVLNLDGEPHLLFVVRDISKRKEAERERLMFIDELEKKNGELERFVYTVSHDLRSPLVTIQGFLGFLEKDIAHGRTERIQRDMDRISNATSTMQQLLDELLELSRIGRQVNPPTEVCLDDLARQAIELVAGSIHQRGVDVEITTDLPTIFADRARLLEVFQNLVENAVKFMGNQDQPRIEIGWRQDNAGASQCEPVFFVRDNGIGIKAPYQEKIFGLFERLNQNIAGTGIGLALVKRIIEVQGGRIWVESRGLGHGSQFCFTLPQTTQSS
jgi:PAS domain S-box-containing protein